MIFIVDHEKVDSLKYKKYGFYSILYFRVFNKLIDK